MSTSTSQLHAYLRANGIELSGSDDDNEAQSQHVVHAQRPSTPEAIHASLSQLEFELASARVWKPVHPSAHHHVQGWDNTGLGPLSRNERSPSHHHHHHHHLARESPQQHASTKQVPLQHSKVTHEHISPRKQPARPPWDSSPVKCRARQNTPDSHLSPVRKLAHAHPKPALNTEHTSPQHPPLHPSQVLATTKLLATPASKLQPPLTTSNARAAALLLPTPPTAPVTAHTRTAPTLTLTNTPAAPGPLSDLLSDWQRLKQKHKHVHDLAHRRAKTALHPHPHPHPHHLAHFSPDPPHSTSHHPAHGHTTRSLSATPHSFWPSDHRPTTQLLHAPLPSAHHHQWQGHNPANHPDKPPATAWSDPTPHIATMPFAGTAYQELLTAQPSLGMLTSPHQQQPPSSSSSNGSHVHGVASRMHGQEHGLPVSMDSTPSLRRDVMRAQHGVPKHAVPVHASAGHADVLVVQHDMLDAHAWPSSSSPAHTVHGTGWVDGDAPHVMVTGAHYAYTHDTQGHGAITNAGEQGQARMRHVSVQTDLCWQDIQDWSTCDRVGHARRGSEGVKAVQSGDMQVAWQGTGGDAWAGEKRRDGLEHGGRLQSQGWGQREKAGAGSDDGTTMMMSVRPDDHKVFSPQSTSTVHTTPMMGGSLQPYTQPLLATPIRYLTPTPAAPAPASERLQENQHSHATATSSSMATPAKPIPLSVHHHKYTHQHHAAAAHNATQRHSPQLHSQQGLDQQGIDHGIATASLTDATPNTHQEAAAPMPSVRSTRLRPDPLQRHANSYSPAPAPELIHAQARVHTLAALPAPASAFSLDADLAGVRQQGNTDQRLGNGSRVVHEGSVQHGQASSAGPDDVERLAAGLPPLLAQKLRQHIERKARRLQRSQQRDRGADNQHQGEADSDSD